MKKKKTSYTIALLIAMSILYGCNSSVIHGTKQTTQSENSSDSVSQNKNNEDIVLTLALTGSPEIDDVIEEFNAADNGYQIVVRRPHDVLGDDGLPVTTSEQESQYADMGILQDILNTDEIDIVCSVSFSNSVYFQILKNKGAFANLYTFMEHDEEVNTSTLNQHILSLNEVDEKLCSLPTFYGATTLIGDAKYVGKKENWTVDDFISHWEAMPDNATISGARQSENIYYTLLRGNLEAFVDYADVQVHFDSPEFRKILEFCDSFESNHGEKGEYDYEAPNFVQEFYIDGIRSCTGLASGEQTLVGYPSTNGEGAFFSDRDVSYAISAKSSPEKQAGAWEFIRTFVTYEYQIEHDIPLVERDVYDEEGRPVGTTMEYSSEWGLPINNQVFEEVAQGIINGKYYDYDSTYVNKGEAYEIVRTTRQDYEKLVEYLNDIDRWEFNSHGPLYTIINEEIMYYFTGEKSLDETVNLIQSRASLWISEQS